MPDPRQTGITAGASWPTMVDLDRGGGMAKLVCTGAALQCSFGTTPSTFAASGTEVGAPTDVGVVSDVGAANVPPFAMCTSLANPAVATATSAASGTLTPQPCTPLLSPWTPGSTRATVDGVAALDDSSQCTCAWGGTVSVSSPGQTKTSVQ
jgi:hypothetical protein